MIDTPPKIIWLFWLQGWDKAPAIVQACLKTWKAHNPDWMIHALSAADLDDYMDAAVLSSSIAGKDMPPEALSDLIRITLLERYGGVWVDSTVYCLKPLDAWLPEKFSSGFFAFANPGPDRMLSSWFLAASKGNYLVQEWRRRAVEYWAHHTERHHYFWFHYLFAEGYMSDPHFRTIWDSTPAVSANEPHHYAPYEKLIAPVSSSDLLLMESPPTPVLKLTHKLPEAQYARDSVLNYFFARADEVWQRTCAVVPKEMHLTPRNFLVAWYGSFDGHGTIGDLLAMQSVVTHLIGLGHNIFHASAGDVRVVGSSHVEWQAESTRAFDAFIFVCGPILKHHPETQALFRKFDGICKIGVSVSLFPADHVNHFDPFDEVLAREGKPERFEDVAILAPTSIYRPARMRKQPPTIGIALRGQQGEYGRDLCLWERTEQIAHEAANQIIEQLGGRILIIENHLRRSGLPQEAIEAQYADCDLIITSRFHGAMMALRHLVPFIAIDQIQGGSKVLSLVGATLWPHVYEARAIDAARLVADAAGLLAGDFDQMLVDARTRTIKCANKTLARLSEIVRTVPSKRFPGNAAPNVMGRQRLIVILGMHRSGTSAITRGLQVMGVNLGETLYGAMKEVNDKGFWEDIHINSLDVEMLSAIDSDWYHLAAIDSIDVEILHKQGYFIRAAELLRQKVCRAPIFGFKDPRLAKLLPFWKGVFSHCQFDVSYIMVVRHPLSVAKSLAKRDGIEAEQSYLLWLGHVITSLTGSAGSKRILVDYDRLMQSPGHELNRIATCLDLEVDPTELQSYVSEYLDQRLRHTVYDLNDLMRDDTCPPIVREVYAALLDVASEKTKFDDLELQNKIARWSDEFERLRSPLLLVDRLLAQKASSTQAVAERDVQIASLNQAVAERDVQIANLNGQLTALLQSTSWRVTRPLRFIKGLVRL